MFAFATPPNTPHANHPPPLKTKTNQKTTTQPLPDLDGWRYSGAATLRGERADVWVLREKLSEDKTATYSFYVSQRTGAPLRLYMMGANIIQYSHIE
jgi:hypothetical protein